MGGGGGVIKDLPFKGIDIYSGEGLILFLVGHFEKGNSGFSSKIINDHTIFFITNVNFRKKIKAKLYQNILQYFSNRLPPSPAKLKNIIVKL